MILWYNKIIETLNIGGQTMNNTLLQASIPTEYKRYLKMAAFDSGMTVTKYLLKLIEKDMKENGAELKAGQNG